MMDWNKALWSRMALSLFVIALAGCQDVNQGLRVLTHNPSDEASSAIAGTYRLDPDHRAVVFWVDHLQFSNYFARFNDVDAVLEFFPDDPAQSHVEVTIDAASVDTRLDVLDEMLTARDMFNAARYPEFRFTSSAIRITGENTGEVTGDLTLAGRTRTVTMDVVFNGTGEDPLTGQEKLGFSAAGSFLRSDFGLGKWIPAVGNRVHFHIEAEFVLEQAETASP